ncbi:MAG: dUTP diphosphatase, partial [bacterium]|nr:dUTP diphosphatase [bacterium]
LVNTGISIEMPVGVYARIAPRSGLAVKNRIAVGGGVIDPDYEGEIKVILFNHGDEDFVVNPGDRIAQIVLERVMLIDASVVPRKAKRGTDRGSAGFMATNYSDGAHLRVKVGPIIGSLVPLPYSNTDMPMPPFQHLFGMRRIYFPFLVMHPRASFSRFTNIPNMKLRMPVAMQVNFVWGCINSCRHGRTPDMWMTSRRARRWDHSREPRRKGAGRPGPFYG